MKIKVLKTHIKKGIPKEWSHCPIALAIKKVMPDCCKVEVGLHNIFIDGYSIAYTPAKAKKFITDFDHGKKVEPFEFNLPPLKG